jgi:hypothetical protein
MDYSYQKENDANINDFLYSDNSVAGADNNRASGVAAQSKVGARPPSASAAKM